MFIYTTIGVGPSVVIICTRTSETAFPTYLFEHLKQSDNELMVFHNAGLGYNDIIKRLFVQKLKLSVS